VKVPDALEQRSSQRSQPGADFDDMIFVPWIDGGNDARDRLPIDEKVLTESFSRDMPTRRHCALAPRLRLDLRHLYGRFHRCE
jgi:hypothetical protein